MKRIRKFYLRSKLNFGKYYGYTVAQVIAMGETAYLRWCNNNMKKIAFAEECNLGQNKESDEECFSDHAMNYYPGEHDQFDIR